MENQIEKQNIGMSVDIDIEVTENEIKNKIMLKQNIGIIVNIAVVNAAQRLNKVIEQKRKS